MGEGPLTGNWGVRISTTPDTVSQVESEPLRLMIDADCRPLYRNILESDQSLLGLTRLKGRQRHGPSG